MKPDDIVLVMIGIGLIIMWAILLSPLISYIWQKF